ncbi:MAG: ABC transporter family substrate-binding protein [Pseudonocardiaceae bacterium]|nr:ABC transporter family substrate-binding protein [Pseudonocardiaceae bacterium]
MPPPSLPSVLPTAIRRGGQVSIRRSRVTRAAALVAGAALVLSACGGGGGGAQGETFAECESNPNTCNSAEAGALRDGGEVAFALEKNISNWNANSAEGNVLETGLVFQSVLPKAFVTQPDLTPAMNENLLVSAEQTNSNPQTLVYQIQPDAVWSDGTPITATDFIYNWRTQNGRDCPDCAAATTSGYDQIRSIEPAGNGKAFTVTMSTPYTDWQALWSGDVVIYPAHIAAQQGDINTPRGLAAAYEYFGRTVPNYSAGPFQIEEFQNNTAVVVTPNPRWYGEGPNLDRLIFRIITEAAQEPPALANDEVQVIYPQPQIDLVQQVRDIPGVSSFIGMGLQWEHYDFNLENPFLAEKPLREAMFTAVDRQGIIDATVGQFTDKAEPLNNHNLMPQQEGYTDVVSQTGYGNGNVDAARQVLSDAGYRMQDERLITPNGRPVPPLRIRYTVGNQIRQDQSELFAQQVAPLGVTVDVEPTDDLGGTLSEGDYDIMVFAWVSDSFPFSGALQLWSTGSESNYGGYSNPEVDRLLAAAASSTNADQARQQLNESNRILAEDAYVLPLYQKPTFIALYDDIANVRNNSSLDGPLYNVEQWGIRAE